MSEIDAEIAILNNADSTLFQVMKAVDNLEKRGHGGTVSIGLSSSATIELLGLYLRKYGLLSGVRVDIHQGNYDDPIGDVDLFLRDGVEHMVLLPFFDNLLPSFEAQLESLTPEILDAKEAEMRGRYRIVFEKAKSLRIVFLGTFHRMGHATEASAMDAVSALLARFNQVLREEAAAFANVRTVDMEDVVRTVGQTAAFDTRFYFRSKAPYTSVFMNELARRAARATRGFGSYFYKVLVLDCDNTLWGGVIGEELLGGIKLGPHDYPGNVFWRMQHEFSALERSGILLCLCSKNNPSDVSEVLQKHPDMVLRDEQFAIKKVNWSDKPSNLRELAKELNVGLDSMVFLDDSAFECEAVRLQLPMVRTVQVPSTLSEYPRVVGEIKELFLAGGISDDSRDKTEQYRLRANAEELKAQFQSQDDYLASLGLKVELSRNARAGVTRISELSMKSNQFNLTTKRYSEPEVRYLLQTQEYAVYSMVVSDKFGNSGLTGVVVLRYTGGVAHVENFFMSCRVIGRGVEMGVWTRIAADAADYGCNELCAEFIPSAKNVQVTDFYDRLGFPLIAETHEGVRRYRLSVRDFIPPRTSWIEMTYVK